MNSETISSVLQNDAIAPERSSRQTIRIEEINSLNFPDDVRQEATEFYLKVFQKRRRGKNRKMAVVYAVNQTYLNRGEYFDIVHIGAEVGLTESDSNKAISACLNNPSLYDLTDNHIGQVDPMAMIDYYCGERVLNLTAEGKKQVVDVYTTAEDAELFNNEGKKAKVAACGYYWLRREGMPIDQAKYLKAFPGVTMKKIEDLSFKVSCLLAETD